MQKPCRSRLCWISQTNTVGFVALCLSISARMCSSKRERFFLDRFRWEVKVVIGGAWDEYVARADERTGIETHHSYQLPASRHAQHFIDVNR